jgi:DNA-binding protein HU-beta
MATVAPQMPKSALFAHCADKFEVKRTEVREWFDELAALAEKQIKGTGEFTLPGVVKLTVRKSKARTGRNPATGQEIKIPAKTRVKATVVKAMKDAVMPRK